MAPRRADSRRTTRSIMRQISRREFVTASGMIGTSLAFGAGLSAGQSPAGRGQSAAPQTPETPAAPMTFKTRLRKALIARPTEDELQQMKAAGFEGVEARVLPPDEAAKMRQVAEGLGMRVHSVLYGWAEFNHPDRSEVDRTFAEAQGALRSAEAFGADAVLLVPCRIGSRGGRGAAAASAAANIRMPRPWEFQIEFDDRTGHITRVVYGDNAPYADYIKAHNHATDASTEWVKRLIPLAEKTKVRIALENVRNNLWVKPAIFGHFVRSFQSPWVKAYYDSGNHE